MRYKTKVFLAVVFLAPVLALSAQVRPFSEADSSASPRIATLKKDIELGNRAAVTQFWEEIRRKNAPLVEAIPGDDHSSMVTFVWQGRSDLNNVVVVGGVAGYEVEKNLLTRLGNSDVWYKTYKVRNDARFTYNFSPNDSLEFKLDLKNMEAVMKRILTFATDPLNPRTCFEPPIESSYLELPAAPVQPWITPAADAPKGKVEEKKIASAILKNERKVWVYTPADYTPGGERYPLLVAFDGEAYTKLVPVPVILDNLAATKRIPPMVAIVLDNPTPTSRNVELPCSAPFADFLAREVVPWMRENYHATTVAACTVVGGSSYGGLAAVWAGLRHPEVFGRVLSQSGTFWWKPDGEAEPEWLIKQFVNSAKVPVRLFLEVGLMESQLTWDEGPPMVVTNRHMRDVLTEKGYPILYQEFNGGHEYLNWRGGFADGLLFLMGK